MLKTKFTETFEKYPGIGTLLPAMGYGDEQIRDLEAEIGTALFERTTRRVALTRAGIDFLAQALAILEKSGEAMAREWFGRRSRP